MGAGAGMARYGIFLLLSVALSVDARPAEDVSKLSSDLKRRLADFEDALEVDMARIRDSHSSHAIPGTFADTKIDHDTEKKKHAKNTAHATNDWVRTMVDKAKIAIAQEKKNGGRQREEIFPDDVVKPSNRSAGGKQGWVRPRWLDVVNMIETAQNMPVYNVYQHCRSDILHEHKLISSSCHKGTCTGAMTGSEGCDLCQGCVESQWRSREGSCNDKSNIFSGATRAPFERNIPIDQIIHDIPVDEPPVRLVTEKLLKKKNSASFTKHRTLNLLGVAYYQYFFHDFLQRNLDPERPVEIEIPEGDRLHGRLDKFTVLGTEFHDFGCPFKFSQDLATAWIDGSQIYGSNTDAHAKLRTRTDGKVRLDHSQRLEFDEGGKAITGHPGGFWVGLFSFHTLFVREHNAICVMLKELHPDWRDDQLFSTARLINSAVMYKIFISSLLPALQPGLEMECIGKWLWGGLSKEDLLQHKSAHFDQSRVYPPVFGQSQQDISTPSSTSEDLGAVNRLHSFTPERLRIYDHANAHPLTLTPLSPIIRSYTALEFSFESTENLKEAESDENLIYSMGIEPAGAIVLRNYPLPYMRSTVDVDNDSSPTMAEIGFDMAVADVLRDRERGTPRYCQYLRLMGKTPPASYSALTNYDTGMVSLLENVYGHGGIEKVDLIIGLIVAAQVTNDGLIPPLTLEILVANLHRKIVSDRFFTTDFTPDTYTPEGMYWIRENDLNSVICRNYESLCSHMDVLKNPLVTWDDHNAQNEGASTVLV